MLVSRSGCIVVFVICGTWCGILFSHEMGPNFASIGEGYDGGTACDGAKKVLSRCANGQKRVLTPTWPNYQDAPHMCTCEMLWFLFPKKNKKTLVSIRWLNFKACICSQLDGCTF